MATITQMTNGARLCRWLTLMLGVSSLLWTGSTPAEVASDELAPPNNPAVPTMPQLEQPPASTNATCSSQQLISLTLDDVPLAEVVKLFTRISGANIIAATSNLQGQVTANLQNTPWRPAFESILERHGLVLTEKVPSSGIYIIDNCRISEEPHISETMTLSYAMVDELSKVVQNVLGKDGTVTPYPSGNALVVNTTAPRIAEIRKIIENLDRPRTQVFVEAKFVQLSEGASRNLGVDWQSLDGWALKPEISATLQAQTTESKSTTTRLRGLSAVLSPTEFDVVLSMLKSSTGAKMISNPKIVVANERIATIKMAQDEPNIKLTTTRATVQNQADLITSELDGTKPYFTYGITVDVTPRVNTSSNITVVIKPELSRKISEKTAPDGNAFPIIERKNVETTFTLGDGRTAAIGGLIETTDTDADSKIPWLGDIPWLGKVLFSHKSRIQSQNEVIIFVTVGVVDPQRTTAENGFIKETTLFGKQVTGKP